MNKDSETILKFQSVTKFYKGKAEPAVDQVSFDIAKGDFFGLLGPNGAGKTTSISIISSLLKPCSGKCIINNLDIASNLKKTKFFIGVVPQDIALYDSLTAKENLLYFGSLYGLPTAKLKSKINDLLTELGLDHVQNKKISTFSGGMKRRINLIAGLLHSPSLLILDEPMVGIDVQSKNVIRKFLKQLNDNGTTIIYTSHIMEDVQKLCNQIGIIDKGKLIANSSPRDLLSANPECENLEAVFLKLTGEKLRD
ncbi:ABC transporter ATP-binding protein [Plebeiibacterium marinum]|uniref:ABC transporter ATP-binding protein n=1 Tax=Plebeiibacterium marinum TaxID=2992111 RepID=A0AAE3MDV1_9BACT|nr:ABC transporter ATP-binding protein [Plebeiobacterium marinum]MCW3805785.1 ABC transporter ATP-binding protein [Plebeiobacterium marinum]